MPFYLNGQTGPQSVANSSSIPMRLSKDGSLVISDALGQFGEPVMQNYGFVYGIASQALLLSATSGGHPTVHNPTGSGVLFIPQYLTVSFISGTTVIGAVVIGDTLNAGAQAATGSPIKTATLVAASPAMRGGGGVSKCNFSPTTNTFTAAPVVTYATAINLGAAAPTGSGNYQHFFNGALIYYPGSAMSVCYTVTTSTALFAISIVGLEIPLPPGT